MTRSAEDLVKRQPAVSIVTSHAYIGSDRMLTLEMILFDTTAVRNCWRIIVHFKSKMLSYKIRQNM